MSVGYAPTDPPPFDPSALTPEDQARIAAQMAQPAPPVLPAAAPPPPAPPPAPAPTGIDAVDPTAVAQNIASVGQPPAPTSAPTATPPAAPTAVPAAPAETPKQTDELKAAQTEAEKSRIANDKAQVDFQKAQEPFVHQREDLANQQVANQQESIRQQREIQRRYQAAEDAANQQIQASQDAIKKFKFRDYFSDGEGGTNWVRKIGAALAAAAGAYGAGLTHGPNYALQILNKDMDDAHQHQVDELGKMKDEEVMQRTGLNDIRAARQKALADLTVNDAARDRLIGTQLEQVAARQKTAEFAPGLAKFAAQLKQDADEKDAAAKKALVELNLKLQDEQRKAHLDTASIDEKEALTKLHNVQAAAGGFARTAHGHGGTGGGGSPSTVGANAEELARRIRQGKDGRPLTDDEIIHAATELHIPLAGKAGVVTLDKVRSVAKFDADAALKAKRAGIQDERIENTEAKEWAKQNGLDAINKSQRELESLEKQLKDNSNNPLNQALAVEKAVSAARGGAASKQALALALHHLGGSLDNAEGIINGWRNGTLGDKQKQNFIDFVNGQLGAAQKEGADKYEAFNKYVESQPEAKRPGLLAARGRLFSGMAGFGGGGGGGDMVTIRNKAGQTRRVTREEAKRLGAINE